MACDDRLQPMCNVEGCDKPAAYRHRVYGDLLCEEHKNILGVCAMPVSDERGE